MLGFTPYSAAAFSDLGSSEELLVVTGVVATTAVGSVLVKGNQSGLTLGSVEGSASVNAVTVAAGANVGFAVTGISSTGAVGTATISETVVTPVTGVEATGAVGQAAFVQSTVALTTGVFSTGSVGSVTTTGTAAIISTGVLATGRVGQALVWGKIVPDPDTRWSRVDPDTGTVWTRIAA